MFTKKLNKLKNEINKLEASLESRCKELDAEKSRRYKAIAFSYHLYREVGDYNLSNIQIGSAVYYYNRCEEARKLLVTFIPEKGYCFMWPHNNAAFYDTYCDSLEQLSSFGKTEQMFTINDRFKAVLEKVTSSV